MGGGGAGGGLENLGTRLSQLPSKLKLKLKLKLSWQFQNLTHFPADIIKILSKVNYGPLKQKTGQYCKIYGTIVPQKMIKYLSQIEHPP